MEIKAFKMKTDGTLQPLDPKTLEELPTEDPAAVKLGPGRPENKPPEQTEIRTEIRMEDVENSLADFLKQLAEKESGPAKEKEQEPSHAFDEVFKPSHYVKDEKVETWDWFELGMTDDMFRGGLLWNIWKYTKRYRKKGNPLKDLGKASRYLDRLVRFESGARMEVIMREIEQEELGDTKVSDS